MPKKISKCAAFCAIQAAAAFIFWLMRPEGLYYQEISQMFINDSGYFLELARVPGGLAAYASEFLVQFYCIPALGAAIAALLLAAITAAAFRAAAAMESAETRFSIAHALPAAALWLAMSDINVTHGLPVAILLSLLAAWLCAAAVRGGSNCRMCLSLTIIPAGYFLLGPAIIIAATAASACIIRHRRGAIWILALWVAATAAVAISARLVMYPLPRFFYGIGYFRYHDFCWPVFGCIAAGAAAAMACLPKRRETSRAARLAMAAAVCGTAFAGIRLYGDSIYQTIRYLKLAHECKWSDIIADAENSAPQSPESLTLLNAALAFEHRLAGEMFRYPQQGPESLCPELQNDMFHPLLSAEPLFWMGLNQYATHYYFEAKAGNPTYRESWYPCMRLAECYIVSGDYPVALKYLRRLQKTTFHKQQATEYISLIESGLIERHLLIQALRSLTLKTDGMQSAYKISDSFKSLVSENPANYLAYEYLMGISLLTGNFDDIAQSAMLASQLGYSSLPEHMQEALACISGQGQPKLSSMIDREVMARYSARDFAPGTFWHYYYNKLSKQR